VPRRQRDGSLRLYSRLSRPEPLLFLSSSSSIVLTRLRAARSRPTTSQKMYEPGPLDLHPGTLTTRPERRTKPGHARSILLHRHTPINKSELSRMLNRIIRVTACPIFEARNEDLTGGWKKLHNEELHNLYSSPSIIRMLD
jgi:hypothetical protein